jgi:hypothetical protein
MPLKRNTIIAAVFILIVLAVGASRRRNRDTVPENEGLDIGFDENDLEELEEALENLKFDDLEAFSVNTTLLEFTDDELKELGDAIESLEFEDLAGLSDS